MNHARTDSSGSNSFYEHLLDSDKEFWDVGAWQFDMGKAWKRHDDTKTSSQWEWKDQLPGAANPAYMIRTDTTGSWVTINSGPDPNLPRLGIDFNKDSDYWWIYTYDGETYKARTWNLCSGVDPEMKWIRIVSGSETVGVTSTDCADGGYGNNPCIAVTAGLNGWAAFRVEQEVAGYGVDCYDFEWQIADDVGDTAAASRAIANDGIWYNGEWEEAGDVDFFRVYVKV